MICHKLIPLHGKRKIKPYSRENIHHTNTGNAKNYGRVEKYIFPSDQKLIAYTRAKNQSFLYTETLNRQTGRIPG